MAVKKTKCFEALLYDGSSVIPVLKFRGRIDVNRSQYVVQVEQGSDGSVSVDLGKNDSFFNFVLCSRGLVAIRQDAEYLSKSEFLEKSGMSPSDVSGLARLLKREAAGLFGISADYMCPCLDRMGSVPFISRMRAVLHECLEPLLAELDISGEDKKRIYNSVVESYVKLRKDDLRQ